MPSSPTPFVPQRRQALALLATLAATCTGLAHATTLADRPINLVVPFAAGGGTDTVARLIGQKLQAALGGTVVIDNRPGANGLIAARAVAQAPADGHTLMFGSNSTHVIAALASKQAVVPGKTMQEAFTIVSVMANAPLVLAVRADSPAKDLRTFLQRAKANKLSYGSFGAGSSAHVMGEVLAESAGIELLHVPYKGSAPALTDLMGGQVDAVFLTVAAVEAMVTAGSVRPLAVTGLQRVRSLPAVPIFEELGVRDMGNAGWFAVFAPAGTPAPVVNTLATAVQAIAADTEVQTRMVALGLEPVVSTPAQALETWRRSLAAAAPIVRKANIVF
ncbi:MAG: tripartite tricarboxylate transporter substrate binding protein [Pseudacidovorax sp.]|uniref:Bug family tripartite tricarboxylate transporter substrate binding protein n=1 Tax=Pseudacidovorax sp. TaxID=1934311 RepID=UPI001B5D7F27|nr:tripartite tricarboxylate transporter substrate binding protein [Pseudacidovorax sp.]MBP6892953.1 tripartite tricarboxylate transporter substrate binding protein [Pseudacidovorax sp.]